MRKLVCMLRKLLLRAETAARICIKCCMEVAFIPSTFYPGIIDGTCKIAGETTGEKVWLYKLISTQQLDSLTDFCCTN